jgi:hypothetical protein
MKKYIKLSFLSVALSLGLTSCLKDDILLDPDNTENVVEIVHTSLPQQKTGTDIAGYVNAFEVVPSATLPITIRYTGAHTAPQDIVVTLAIDPSIITTYNTQNATSFIALPNSLYTMPMTVTIPKGGKEAVVQVSLKPNQFDLSKSYALALKIESVSSGIISGNFGRALIYVAAKNKYDGVYTIAANAATFRDVSGPTSTGSYPKTIHLVTTGPNSVAYFDPNLNGGFLGYRFLAAGAGTYYGNFAPVFEFDANDNVTSVTNHPSYANNSQLRTAKLDPTGVNKITFGSNGTPSTIEVSYIMVQGTLDRVFITEKFVYVGPRP